MDTPGTPLTPRAGLQGYTTHGQTVCCIAWGGPAVLLSTDVCFPLIKYFCLIQPVCYVWTVLLWWFLSLQHIHTNVLLYIYLIMCACVCTSVRVLVCMHVCTYVCSCVTVQVWLSEDDLQVSIPILFFHYVSPEWNLGHWS